VQTKHTDPDESWYGFERLTCVSIQTRMVLEHLLAKEKEWLREHNRRCLHLRLKVICLGSKMSLISFSHRSFGFHCLPTYRSLFTRPSCYHYA
jgi:hypothetical protein